MKKHFCFARLIACCLSPTKQIFMRTIFSLWANVTNAHSSFRYYFEVMCWMWWNWFIYSALTRVSYKAAQSINSTLQVQMVKQRDAHTQHTRTLDMEIDNLLVLNWPIQWWPKFTLKIFNHFIIRDTLPLPNIIIIPFMIYTIALHSTYKMESARKIRLQQKKTKFASRRQMK